MENTKINQNAMERIYCEIVNNQLGDLKKFPPFFVFEGPHHVGKTFVSNHVRKGLKNEYDIILKKAFYNHTTFGQLHKILIKLSDNYKFLCQSNPSLATLTMLSCLLENLVDSKKRASKSKNHLIMFDRYLASLKFKRKLADNFWPKGFGNWLENKLPKPKAVFLLSVSPKTIDERAKRMKKNGRKFNDSYKEVLEKSFNYFNSLSKKKNVVKFKNEDGKDPTKKIIKAIRSLV